MLRNKGRRHQAPQFVPEEGWKVVAGEERDGALDRQVGLGQGLQVGLLVLPGRVLAGEGVELGLGFDMALERVRGGEDRVCR